MAPREGRGKSTDAHKLFFLQGCAGDSEGREKAREKKRAHTHAPLHLALLPSLRNPISICKRSRFALWKCQQRGAASSVDVLGSISCPWPRGTWGAGAPRALKPFASPLCFPPHPLFPLLQAQPGNAQIPCHSLSPTPAFSPNSILGRKATLTSPQPRSHRAGSHQLPTPFLAQTRVSILFPPAMLGACLTSHLSCLPSTVTQSWDSGATLPGARVHPRQPSCPDNYKMFTSLGLPTVFLPFPSINMDAQLLLNRTNSNKEGQAASRRSLPPSAAAVPDSGGLEARGWIGIFLPKCQAQVSVKTKEC